MGAAQKRLKLFPRRTISAIGAPEPHFSDIQELV
jgi:hypothetical protein